ncbi:hypothetical protein [Sandaracinus amylolyticus]|uniref:Uncharacterized protein n=1 Tax=Sandaracinus amylolyticus TaxID=927083 RepID=A0A0F6YLW4_9BACT|nr:hypothetical protein [Sandaracinus amylolyticus]AKF09682.1 hypothetical protein DB32_006831 [Sandaracinus amylolyticus]
MTHPRFASIFVPALALALLTAPSAARACERIGPPGPPPADQSELHWGIAFGVGSAIELTVIGAQIAAGAEMFPDWAAALELSLGIAQSVAAPLVMQSAHAANLCSAGPTTSDEGAIAAGFLLFAGGWLIAHALWSFGDGPIDSEPTILPSVSFDRDAVALHVLGTF